MPRYSGIAQSVEHLTVKFGAVQEKVSEKTAEICGFLIFIRRTLATIFGKKCAFFMLFIAFYCPLFLQKLYADIRNTQIYGFVYRIFIFFVQSYDE